MTVWAIIAWCAAAMMWLGALLLYRAARRSQAAALDAWRTAREAETRAEAERLLRDAEVD